MTRLRRDLCAMCGAPTPFDPRCPSKGRRAFFCGRRCAVAAARFRYRGKPVPYAYGRAPRVFQDLTGKAFGHLTVIGDGTKAAVVTRCECGAVETRSRRALVVTAHRGHTSACRACRARLHASAASRAPGAKVGTCSWCREPAKRFECAACNRRATRNGREDDGRPIYRSTYGPRLAVERQAGDR